MKKEYKPFEKFNIVGSISTNSLFALVLLFTSGGLFQGIWMHCGFNDFQIGLITSLTSLAQCLAMVASLWFADSVKKPVKIMGYCLFPGALYFAYLGVTFLLGGVPP
ncbi:MAG: hypothetical protein MJ078_04890 [Clostridia bacterium]|nr:hypothetical protein [Clostridia bacterium]